MKSYIKIALVAIIILIIGLIIYFVWSALATPAPETSIPVPGGSSLPAASSTSSETGNQIREGNQPGNGETPLTLVKISENQVFDFWTDIQTKEIYYLNPEGRIFSGKNGPDLEISRQSLNAPNSIEISPNGQRVLAAFGDPRLPQWGIFDVIDESWRPLPDNILKTTWGENSDILVGFVKNGANINLSSINLAQSQPVYKIISKDLRFEDISLELLSPQNLAISENPSVDYLGRIWNLNLKDLSLSQMFSPENGLIMKLSTDKKIIFVFSPANGFRILNAANLGLATPVPFSTLPSKCSPDSSIVYCFVPENLPENTVMPDDYFQKKIHTNDVLYKIDIPNDEVSRVSFLGNAGSIDAKNPVVNAGNLFFINLYDNSLYSLAI